MQQPYGIGKSTVGDIKKNRIKLEQFKKKTVEMGMKTANIKAMKFGEHKELDEALAKATARSVFTDPE